MRRRSSKTFIEYDASNGVALRPTDVASLSDGGDVVLRHVWQARDVDSLVMPAVLGAARTLAMRASTKLGRPVSVRSRNGAMLFTVNSSEEP